MEPRRFDALTRAFARPASRRRTLAGIIAVAAAPLTAAANVEPANCLAIGKRCKLASDQDAGHGHGKGGKGGMGKHHPPSCNKCCSRYGAAGADGKARCACKSEGIACDGDAQCCSGQCRSTACTACPPSTVFCPDGCANLQTDAQHCGACDHACAAGQRCVGGRCVCDGTSCPPGCCANDGSCQRGTTDQACGVCTTCNGTQCVNATACCGAASVCQSGTCQTCGDGQQCRGGACVCDATSCPNGCCNGDTCVKFADQTDQQCGTNGTACSACTGHDTCGGGGTQGVCGCTRQCAGRCNGEPDNCGGTCGCPECMACNGGVCINQPDGADCGGAGSGLRCCGGTCPPAQTCLPNGTCCDETTTCTQCCGAKASGSAACSETGGYGCVDAEPIETCINDSGCGDAYGAAICVCGRCCVTSGGDGNCPDPTRCCSGACNGSICA
jgi:hypothetical protein